MMELKEKSQHTEPADNNLYVNTAFRHSDLSLIKTEENEYEDLQRGSGSTSGRTQFEKAPRKLSKRLVYVLFGLIVPLYVAAVAVVIVLNIPKESETVNAINGLWSSWGQWGDCSAPCDFGMERRERLCIGAKPDTTGEVCFGEPVEYRLCKTQSCAVVNGEWSAWGPWGNCSATCDFGMKRRERSCTDPEPGEGGKYCSGEPAEYQTCKDKSCTVVNGEWSAWGPWGNCSATCDFGVKRRERSCTDPEPGVGGKYCSGEPAEYQTCKDKSCTVVNGEWSAWGPWGNCSATCDFGVKRRERSCTDPEPGVGGKYCSGEPAEYQTCKDKSCTVVNGEWSAWGPWGNCSATCDFGVKRRERSCTDTEPGIGGKYCFGEPAEYQTCKDKSCTVDWSSWSSWSSCSLTCGGIQYRSRFCANPSDLGQFCIGDPVQVQACNTNRCPYATSGFSVAYPVAITQTTLIFNTTRYQQGSDYSISTGVFTCSIPGTYLFSVNLVKTRDGTASSVYCHLYRNWELQAYINVNPFEGDPDRGNAAVSSTVVMSLKSGDLVRLMICSPVSSMEPWSSFTGALIFPN